MNLYKYQDALITSLPERIRLDDGTTRTSLQELSEQDLMGLGFSIYEIISAESYDTQTQRLSGSYILDEESKTATEEVVDIDLDELRQTKLQEFEAQETAERSVGMTVGELKVKTEPYDLTRWTQLMVKIMAFDPATVEIFDFDGNPHVLSKADAISLLVAISENETSILNKSGIASQAVKNALTAQDILAVTR